jgi:hypothetical protein
MPTLRQLLKEGESFKYGIDYRTVEAEKQTVSDFEQNGLRPNRINLGADLYGVETLRITRQSTSILDDMKANANANQGLLGGVIGVVRNKVNSFASKLGFPVLQIPTRVSNDDRLSKAIKGRGKDSIPEALAKIKEGSGGALGIVGKFLSQSAKGNPKEIGRRALGTAANIGKDLAKGLLFGTGETDANSVQNRTLSLRNEEVKYASDKRFNYSSLVRFPLNGGGEKGLLSILEDIQNRDASVQSFIRRQRREDTRDFSQTIFSQTPSGSIIPQFSVDNLTQNIPAKRDKTNKYTDTRFNPVMVLPFLNETSDGSNGKFRTLSDTINSSSLFDGESDELDNYDFIPLKFYSVAKDKTVYFKATVNGISENFSPSWDTSNFIGNPYSFYTYQSINRKIDFSFSIYSLSSGEHKKNWEKIDFLSSLVYPQNTTNDVYVTPPLLKFTLGNMYKNKLGFIESLSYTIDDSTPWEIGYDVERGQGPLLNRITDISRSGDMSQYKLPTIINVSVSYQIIETSNDVVGKKLYPYGTSMIYGEQ